MDNMIDKFGENLKTLFESQNSTLYVTAPVVSGDYVPFNDDVNVVASTLKMYGAIVDSIDEDMIIARCISKDSVEQTVDYLDNDDKVDTYELNVWTTDPLSGVTTPVEEIDLDTLPSFQNLTIEIVIFINPQYVQYDSYYQDYDDSQESEPLSEAMQRKPLCIALAQTKTNTHGGKFIITPSPKNKNCVWVSIEYKFDPNMTHDAFFQKNKDLIKKDLEIVNTGEISKKFEKKGLKCSGKLSLDDSDVKLASKHGQKGYLDTPDALEFKGDSNIDCQQLLEMFEGSTLHAAPDALYEIERKVKVNFRGVKRIKMQCQHGFKYDPERRVCVKIGGSELATMRRAKIKTVRTKRALGTGYKLRTVRKTKRAVRFRKLLGVR